MTIAAGTIIVDVHGLDRALGQAAGTLLPEVTKVVYKNGALLRTRVRARASGRPGPRVQTGDYRRGISLQRGVAVGVGGTPAPFATVFSNSPQGRRLESGFVGVDSLGRNYNQPPFPHWGPAAVEVEAATNRDMDHLVAELLRRIA